MRRAVVGRGGQPAAVVGEGQVDDARRRLSARARVQVVHGRVARAVRVGKQAVQLDARARRASHGQQVTVGRHLHARDALAVHGDEVRHDGRVGQL